MASKMNKKELYQAFKDLKQEQLRDSLFHSQEIQELKKNIDTCLKYCENIKEQNDKLKKENRKFKDNGGFVSPDCANGMVSQIKDQLILKLKKENEELKKGLKVI